MCACLSKPVPSDSVLAAGVLANYSECSQHALSTLPVPDANRFFNGGDEDFTVADLSGSGGGAQHRQDLLQARVRHHQLQLHFGNELDCVFRAPVDLGVALLPAVA